MAVSRAPAFTGFTPDAIQFLADLAANNDRSWFQPRKADYERLLKEPLEALVVALAERFEARNIPLVADPKTSPFRIYRDVRFSKDKSPYKTGVSASLPVVGQDRKGMGGVGGVGGYFHLEPGEVYVGGGMWHPDRERLAAFRRLVVDDTRRVEAALEDPAFLAAFGPVNSDGEDLRRVPPGYPKDHPKAEWLRLRDVVFGRRLSDADVMSPELPDTLADSLAAAMPVLRFLASLP